MNRLDRPVWWSLATHHLDLGVGDDRARRYLPDVNRFASAGDDSPEALGALTDLIGPEDPVYLLQRPRIVLPPRVRVLKEATGVQMVYPQSTPQDIEGGDLIGLGDRDAAEMLALATLTEPGPFLPRTHHMGRFWGVRIDGRLAAMAGERMRFPGYTEVSGVCTHPDFRGRGMARRLSAHVTRLILDRGDTPFLHAWTTNQPAISLYESLGFRLRCEVHVAMLARA